MSQKYVYKRDGRTAVFDVTKIENAILKAFKHVDGEITPYAKEKAKNIAQYIKNRVDQEDKIFTIEEIQDLVEHGLSSTKRKDVCKAYILYREERTKARGNTIDNAVKELLDGTSDFWNTENSNKNAKWVTTQRDYIAGIASKDIAERFILSQEIVDAHKKGAIHIHDMDYMAQSTLHNCELLNLEDMLQNGTKINGVMIEKPHKFLTAATIATQIILGVSSSSYGGCSITLTHLAPFVRDSYNYYYNKYIEWGFSAEQSKIFAEKDTKKEVKDGIQTINYQLNSMTNTNGQSPFLSIFMWINETEEYKNELAMLIEEMLKQRILGVKNEKGVYISPAFPKLLYCLDENNIHEGDEYWYLTEIAAKCTAKRLVPDYISAKKMREYKVDKNGIGHVFPCMGCRSFLHVWDKDPNKYYGRFNIGVSTVNLPYIAYESEGNIEKFWALMEYYTELCHQAQKIRAKRLCSTKAEVAPILWCDGALARLDPKDTLEQLITSGYCSSSLGYAGLYECTKRMIGESHTSANGEKFALEIMNYLNAQCNKWKAAENIAYSVYGTPIESTTYKFAKSLRNWGYKKDYVTNSYHVHVTEKISPFDKLLFESKFQKLSPGGAISYCETSDLTHNIPAVLEIINFIYDNIMYAELNTKSDYCQICGYDKEILIKEDENGNHYYECPNCGNKNTDKMNIARRVCGYISTTVPNEGRLEEIAERYVHLDDHEVE